MLQAIMVRDQKRRTRLVQRLADYILMHGMRGASLRPLAAAMGTSDRMLLYYFIDKAALIAAALEETAKRMTALLDASRPSVRMTPAELEAHLLPLLFDKAVWPFMQLWLEIASLSARGDDTCRRVGEAIARGFITWLADHLEGNEDVCTTDATRLLMSIEGAVLLTSLGLGDAVQGATKRA